MSTIPYATVRSALATMGIDDPEDVRGITMTPHEIVVVRLDTRDGGKHYTTDMGRIVLTEETTRIDYSAGAVPGSTIPGTLGPGGWPLVETVTVDPVTITNVGLLPDAIPGCICAVNSLPIHDTSDGTISDWTYRRVPDLACTARH